MDHTTRRRLLRGASVAGLAGLAGCSGLVGGAAENTAGAAAGQIGSGRSPFGDRTIEGGTSMAEMPAMSGELTVYSGRGEPLVGEFVSFLEERYDDLTLRVRYNSAAELVNQLETEGSESPADAFFSVNAGSLGAVAEQGRTVELPEDVVELVPGEFSSPDDDWVGTSGRARSVPFNTESLSEADVPEDIFAFPDTEAFRDAIGCAPTYSSFQAFVTAMRVLNGEDRTREWLNAMLDLGLDTSYSDEFLVSQAVADGELDAGFANHYYIQRVLAGRPDAPVATAFTRNDAGAIFNVAGAAALDTAADGDLAANFVRHLLSAEAQDYFARETFEYPLVPEVEPIGRLPSVDELSPPEGLDLTELSDIEGTVELLRDVGAL
jgi:iron(III) transport system substrate-binding protein